MTSDSLTAQDLLLAYANGIFPMAESRDDAGIHWIEPHMRGILPLDAFHISRSLRKRINRGGFEVTTNQAFKEVIEACADREETWINPMLHALYGELHEMGFAHSLEIWMDQKLSGGVFGITLGGGFFGESMFSARTDGSKLALTAMTYHLRALGFTLFDTQFITPHLQSLGGIEIPQSEYLRMLSKALETNASFQPFPSDVPLAHLLQRSTQTS